MQVLEHEGTSVGLGEVIESHLSILIQNGECADNVKVRDVTIAEDGKSVEVELSDDSILHIEWQAPLGTPWD